jgi:uncharacterized protein YheU (UPF0270 family)
MIVPWQDIDKATLENLIQEYVTRDGTDYGEQEVSLETKVAQVHERLKTGAAVVWFDEGTETVNILPREDIDPADL